MHHSFPILAGTWREGSGRFWRSTQNGNHFTWVQDGTNRMATGTIVATDSLGTFSSSWVIHITFDGNAKGGGIHARLISNTDGSVLSGLGDTFQRVNFAEVQSPANVYNIVGMHQEGIQPHGNLLGCLYHENSCKMWEVTANNHTGHFVMRNQTDGRLADGYIVRDVFANKFVIFISFHNQNSDVVIRSETNDLNVLPLSNGDCMQCEGTKTVNSLSFSIGGLTVGLSSSSSYSNQSNTATSHNSTSCNTISGYATPIQPSVSAPYLNQPGQYPGSVYQTQPFMYEPTPGSTIATMMFPPQQPFGQPNYQPNQPSCQPSMYVPPHQPLGQPTMSYPPVSMGFSQPTVYPTVTSSVLGQSIIKGCQHAVSSHEMFNIVVSYTNMQCNPIPASEISQIISMFNFENDKVKVLEQLKMTNNIAEMTCSSAAAIISSLVLSGSNKLKAVYDLGVYMVDRRQNAETIVQCFNFIADQQKVRQHLLEC